jgi:uncharacterized membrane protein required for colicin V production
MGIDLLFIIMAAYGFYFGYAFGLIRVVFFIASLMGAFIVAMYVTPDTAQLIQVTLEVDSAVLPFVAFVITIVGVMLVARIVFKLLEENIKSKQVGQMAQSIGGFLMSGLFIFLFSVLVTFFSAGHVIKPDSARATSFFYKYIEKIPTHGTDLLKAVMPFMDNFSRYMKAALERLETGKKQVNPLDDLKHVYSDEDSTAILQDSLLQDSLNLENNGGEVLQDSSGTNIRDTIK